MTELFTRDGTKYTGQVYKTASGARCFSRDRMCGRCGGAGGADKWAHTGWTCFQCGGKRVVGTEIVKLYDAEKLAKLNATKAKADAKREAKYQAKREAEAEATAARSNAFFAKHGDLIERAKGYQDSFIRDVIDGAVRYCEMTDGQADAVAAAIDRKVAQAAVRAASDHVGAIGDRITVKVKVERVIYFERPAFNAPWTTETVYIATMRDEAGNAIVSKGRFAPEEGATLTIKATVKEHSMYRDQRQTVVQRIKEMEAA
jgi:hypothetical protein